MKSAGLEHGEDHLNLSRRYLAFLWLAFHSDTGRFRNFPRLRPHMA